MTVTCPRCGNPARAGANFCAACGTALTTSARQLQPGQHMRNGDYCIVRPLSKGGMGVIYLAENMQAFGRLCVIKEMLDYFDPSDPQQVANAQKRFEAEARTLAQLRHPGIPGIQAYFSSKDGHNYIVMEYIEGKSLDAAVNKIDASGRRLPVWNMSPAQIVGYGVQLCEILEYLAGLTPPVVHHDIKPANIIIDKNTGNARLVDFGTARARLTAQPGGKVGLQKSSIYGTAGYAPPEQYQGQSEPRSDVYALAATLYYLLTGDDPSDHPFKFPQLAGLPLNLAPILAKALESDASRRATAAEFRQRLTASLSPKTPARKTRARSPKLKPHESYALVADQGIPDAARPAVIRYLKQKLGLTAMNAEILTWQTPAGIARGLDASQATSLEKDLRALGVQVKRVPTSQVLGWRTGIRDLDKRLVTKGTAKVRLTGIPGDRVCHCYRCGHEWKTRARKLLAKCPHCKSTTWSQHRLFQCAICGHQFPHGNLSGAAHKLFPKCPACHTQAWHPKQQPRLRKGVLHADAGKVLIGHTATTEVILTPRGGSANLHGQVTPAVPWLKTNQPEFSGDRIQVVVDTTGMATKQIHVGRMDVVSNAGRSQIEVMVYVEEPPRLEVGTPQIDFGVLNAREERTLKVVINNAGGQVLEGTVSGAPDWLRLSRSDFRGNQIEMGLTVRGRDLLVAGRNTATLTIDSSGGKANVDVVATALPTTLVVEPTSLDFGYQPRGRHVRRTLTLTNPGVSTLQGQIIASEPWTTVDPPEFSGNQVRVSVTANTEGLAPAGTFDAQLTITSNGGGAAIPARIEVSPYRWLEHTLRHHPWLQVTCASLLIMAAAGTLLLALALAPRFTISPPMQVSQVAWAAAAPRLLLIRDNNIFRLETATGGHDFRLVRSGLQPATVAISADGRWMAWTDAQGDLEIWQVNAQSVRHLTFDAPIAGIRFDATDARLAWLAADGTFGWLDPTVRVFQRTGSHDDETEHLAFSPDGGWLAVGSSEQIAIYSTEDGSLEFQLPTPSDMIALALAPEGRELAWGTSMGQVSRWDPDTAGVRELPGSPTAVVVAMAYDLTGRHLAWARSDGQIIVWDLNHDRLSYSTTVAGKVSSLSFGPDEERLAVGTSVGLEIIAIDKETSP